MTDENEKSGNMGGGCRRGRGKWFFFIPVIAVAAIFLFGAIVMYLWNAVMPGIFTGLGHISLCQAIGLLILAKILFGSGFRGRRGCGCGCHRGGWRGGYRGRHWKEKWMNMSEEEKAKFKDEWKKRCEPVEPC